MEVIDVIALLIGLIQFVCYTIVLIRMFQAKGVLHGILGMLCTLYAFIWGWINKDSYNLGKIMILWTIAMVIFLLPLVIGVIVFMTTPTVQPVFEQPQ